MPKRVKARQRGMLDILADLLKTCEESTKRTHVIYRANLSTSCFRDYLQIALRGGLVQENEQDRSLRVTDKGRLFLQYYYTVEQLLRDDKEVNGENTLRISSKVLTNNELAN
jgi:predicted transcriptional regulator